jgi:hypothetical protein
MDNTKPKPKKKTNPKPKMRRYHEVSTYGFGLWLWSKLQERGKTESWLAHKCNMNVNSISGYICGKHLPRLTTVWRMCVILDCDFIDACNALQDDLKAMRFPDM